MSWTGIENWELRRNNQESILTSIENRVSTYFWTVLYFSESMSYPVSPLVNQLKSINQPQIIQSDGQSLNSKVSYSVNQPAN